MIFSPASSTFAGGWKIAVSEKPGSPGMLYCFNAIALSALAPADT